VVTQIVNGLAATKTRRALVRAITETGRVYYETAAKDAYDMAAGVKVTERVRELLRAEWIRVAEAGEARTGESITRTYYRVTNYGLAVLRGEQ
jgi:ribosomal 50S subunit-recycling heat shock protein